MVRSISVVCVAGALVVFFGGCSPPSVSPLEILEEHDLSELGHVVGLTRDGQGHWVALTADGSVHTRYGDEWLEQIRLAVGPLLDIVYIGDRGRFAITMPNEGYILNLGWGSFTRYFCYLPGDEFREEQPPVVEGPTLEVSRAVAYDPAEGLLFAQPQTLRNDPGGEAIFSELGIFDAATGREIEFINLDDPSFSAGAMVALGAGRLILGTGSQIHLFDIWTRVLTPLRDLGSVGMHEIDAMMFEPESEQLFIVDGPTGRTIALDLRPTIRP